MPYVILYRSEKDGRVYGYVGEPAHGLVEFNSLTEVMEAFDKGVIPEDAAVQTVECDGM